MAARKKFRGRDRFGRMKGRVVEELNEKTSGPEGLRYRQLI
jgi:hypothetical protein